MSTPTKRAKLYQEFREYQQLSEDKKVVFREKIEQEALKRSEPEKALIREAIQQNVEELRTRLEEIKAKIESSALHSQ